MPSPRPTLATYLDAHPHDPARAVAEYRAALHAWESERTVEGARGPTLPWRPLAVGACLLVVALLAMRALGGCSAVGPGPGDCARDCHDAHGVGTAALLDCVAACSDGAGQRTEGSGR